MTTALKMAESNAFMRRIPPDEVIDAMQEVGAKMDSAFRETAAGGLAATRTGQEIAQRIMKE